MTATTAITVSKLRREVKIARIAAKHARHEEDRTRSRRLARRLEDQLLDLVAAA